jgi:hypothetical protein
MKFLDQLEIMYDSNLVFNYCFYATCLSNLVSFNFKYFSVKLSDKCKASSFKKLDKVRKNKFHVKFFSLKMN